MNSFTFLSPDERNMEFFAGGGEEGGKSHNVVFFLLFTSVVVSLFGLTMLYSTSYGRGNALFIKQIVWDVLGAGLALAVFLVGYRKFLSYSLYLLLFCAVLLVVPCFFSPVNGAYRWIRLPGGFSVQPSEFAKIALILFLVHYCSTKQGGLNSMKVFLPALGALMMIALLVFLGKDLGTTFLICLVAWIIFFVAGVRIFLLSIFPLIGIPILMVYLSLFDAERLSRIKSFLNPELVSDESGYQLWNSLMALGSGHWTGLGFTESKLKAFYLPEAHTDFILSIVGEELGLITMIMVILCYITIFFSSLSISKHAVDRQGGVLAFALVVNIALQAVINIGVISGLFPTKGMPAPFISYGGSNILMCAVSVGLILSVAEKDEFSFFDAPVSLKMNMEVEDGGI
jgi:cell division protein FtsW